MAQSQYAAAMRAVNDFGDQAGLERLRAEMKRLLAEEAKMADRPHKARAEFYRRRVEEAHPQLNAQVSANLAAYHASMAVLEKLG